MLAAFFFLLTTMTWQGAVTTAYIGPFPTLETCQVMREETARRVSAQGWVNSARMEGCQVQATVYREGNDYGSEYSVSR